MYYVKYSCFASIHGLSPNWILKFKFYFLWHYSFLVKSVLACWNSIYIKCCCFSTGVFLHCKFKHPYTARKISVDFTLENCQPCYQKKMFILQNKYLQTVLFYCNIFLNNWKLIINTYFMSVIDLSLYG